jgi:hypothetical protein
MHHDPLGGLLVVLFIVAFLCAVGGGRKQS